MSSKALFIVLNIVGGLAVLGSYGYGFATQPDPGAALWGGVPESARSLYTVNMLLSAAGYFAFTSYFLLRTDETSRFLGGRDFGVINLLYALVLFPSALWMPLTFRYVAEPSGLLWWGIRFDLALVGIGAVGLLAALINVQPRNAPTWRALAILGLIPFCLQTAVLDALVWPYFYH